MATIQRLNTTYTKDNQNPVQMDVDKLFLYKTLKKKHSTGSLRSQLSSDDLPGLSAASLKRRKSAQLEMKMREKTAHNGKRAYYSNNRAEDANNANTASRLSGVVSSWLF
mmetsp:Transcript_25021/g.28008  ORF Transcript_25021/g.28008 Transcript_25021/m.28008 type:complete len:110 (+) Transcript_25021:193-522(+)